MNTGAHFAAQIGLLTFSVTSTALLPVRAANAADFDITAAGRPDVRLSVTGVSNNANDPVGPFALFQAGGKDNPDNLHQFWWWYRVGDAGRESAVNGNNVEWTTGVNNTRQATATFTLADKVTADMYFNIEATETAGVFNSTLVLTNRRSDPVTVSLFSYLDMDLAGTAAGDSAEADNPLKQVDITDGPWMADYRPTPAGIRGAPEQPTRYQTAAFSTIRNALTDNAKTTLNNTGFPFGPGDFTTAYQWDVTLAANDIKSLGVQVTVFPVPEPSVVCLIIGAWALLLTSRGGRVEAKG